MKMREEEEEEEGKRLEDALLGRRVEENAGVVDRRVEDEERRWKSK